MINSYVISYKPIKKSNKLFYYEVVSLSKRGAIKKAWCRNNLSRKKKNLNLIAYKEFNKKAKIIKIKKLGLISGLMKLFKK